jgi:hypothetical protein
MKAGEIVLIRLAQFGGGAQKLRPALLLATLPGPYQTHLVCGISTQLSQLRQTGTSCFSRATSISPRVAFTERQLSD